MARKRKFRNMLASENPIGQKRRFLGKQYVLVIRGSNLAHMDNYAENLRNNGIPARVTRFPYVLETYGVWARHKEYKRKRR